MNDIIIETYIIICITRNFHFPSSIWLKESHPRSFVFFGFKCSFFHHSFFICVSKFCSLICGVKSCQDVDIWSSNCETSRIKGPLYPPWEPLGDDARPPAGASVPVRQGRLDRLAGPLPCDRGHAFQRDTVYCFFLSELRLVLFFWVICCGWCGWYFYDRFRSWSNQLEIFNHKSSKKPQLVFRALFLCLHKRSPGNRPNIDRSQIPWEAEAADFLQRGNGAGPAF